MCPQRKHSNVCLSPRAFVAAIMLIPHLGQIGLAGQFGIASS